MLAQINGAQIGFDDDGEGAPMVFIHAGIADRSMWDHQIAHFSPNHRVIRIDLRGFGESPMPETPFANHEDANALLRHLGVGPAIVIGISMGGDVAVDLALSHPERVSHLVLVSTLAAMDEPSDALKANWADAEAAFERGELDLASEIEVEGWIVGEGRTKADLDPEFLEKTSAMIGKIWNRVVGMPEVAEIELDPPRTERLAEIAARVVLIRGDHDFPDVTASMDCLHAKIPGSALHIIPNSSHLPPLEHPDEFNRLLEEILAGT